MLPRIFIVVPCYNEESVISETSSRLKEKLNNLILAAEISDSSRVVFIDDGSKDKTWEMISRLHENDKLFQGIRLSKNRGHQNALLAGLMTVREIADAVISMDADLQDDINAVDQMIEKFKSGCDVVYGVRSSRKTDSAFKRTTAQSYYRMMDRLGAKTVYNHADYRLMSRKALEALSCFGEVNLFLRGMVPMLGFKTDIVYYERGVRFAGESKYPLKKMLSFAMEGITSLSTKPIKLITSLGFLIFFVSFLVFVYSIVRFFTGQTVAGWTTTVLSVWAIGGLIMISLGVIGEYIGKIYLETKHRPRYIIDSYLKDETDSVNINDPAV